MSSAAQMFTSRREVNGRWVAVMKNRRDDRMMVPAKWRTRYFLAGEIHEFILFRPDVDRDVEMSLVSYLGFAKIVDGGVVAVGDELQLAGRMIGTVHGFEETHAPNHYNILIASEELPTGAEIGLEIDAPVTFFPAPDAAVEPDTTRRVGSPQPHPDHLSSHRH